MRPLKYILILFFLTRLTNLTLLPIFTDEANYLEWGWRALHGQPFYSLFDAKQPGLMWIFAAFEILFPDPLWGARLVSVLFGFANLLLIYRISIKLFGQKTAVVGTILYTLTPLFLFFDRQALMESSLITISLSSFYITSSLKQKPSIKNALLLGLVLGVGIWIKSTTFVFLLTSILAVFYIAFSSRQITRYLTLLTYTLMVFFLISFPLLLHPEFISTWSRNSGYTLSISQILSLPLHTWQANITTNLVLWFLLLTPPIFITGIISLYSLARKSRLLVFWIIFPITFFLITSKFSGFMFQRHSTPFLPLLLLPAASFLSSHRKTLYCSLISSILISCTLIFSPPSYFHLLSRFTRYSYIEGYITGGGAANYTGYQVTAIMNYLKSVSPTQNILVGLPLANYNPTAAIFVYARKIPHLTPIYFDSQILSNLSSYDCLKTPQPLYYVSIEESDTDLLKLL